MIPKSRLVILALCALPALVSDAAQAQQLGALELLDIKPIDEEPRDYQIGESFKLNFSRTALTRVGGAGNVRVRIFNGSKSFLATRENHYQIDGCLFYQTAIYHARDYNGGVRIVANPDNPVVFDRFWLGNPGEDLRDRHYVLVFEKEDGSAVREVKLFPTDAASYFDSGFEIVVKAPAALSPGQRSSLRDYFASAAAKSLAVVQQLLGLANEDEVEVQTVAPTLPQVEDPPCRVVITRLDGALAVLEPYDCSIRTTPDSVGDQVPKGCGPPVS